MLKTNSAIYKFFKPFKRSLCTIDALELYQFSVPIRLISNLLANKLDKDFRKQFQNQAIASWLEQQTVILEQIFIW